MFTSPPPASQRRLPKASVIASLIVLTGLLLLWLWPQAVQAQNPDWSERNFPNMNRAPAGIVTVQSAPGTATRTRLQSNFVDPAPNWSDWNYDDSTWLPAYVVNPDPLWGNPLAPAALIWGGTPQGAGPPYLIPNTPDPQYLYARSNFCIPLNASFASVNSLGDIQFQIAASPGTFQIDYNGNNLQGGSTITETQAYNLNVPADAFNTAKRLGKNTLALRAYESDPTSDNRAAVAFRWSIDYTLDPTALTATVSTPAIVGQPVTFNAVNNSLGGSPGFTYIWTLPDSSTATGPSINDTPTTPGTYIITLVAEDADGCQSIPIQLSYEVLPAPLTSVSIAGPTAGVIGPMYTFTATAALTNAGLPITYTWTADEQAQVQNGSVNSLQDSVGFAWATPGVKVITVTAQNYSNTVATTHTITIAPTDLTAVTIAGPTTGLPGQTYAFTGTASPPTATLPINYSWNSGGGTPATSNEANGGIAHSASFSWAAPGVYTINLTATNNGSAGSASDSHTITIIDPNTPVTGVALAGPTTGLTGQAYAFTATVAPPTATTPISYSWQVDNQTPVSVNLADASNAQTFTWNTAGTYVLTVTVQNPGGGWAQTTHTIIISAAPIPLTGLTLAGPTTGLTGQSYVFTATATPNTATTPLSYTWQTVGQGTVNATGAGFSNSQAFTWNTPGTYTLTVTALNPAGQVVTATHSIVISAPLVPPTAPTAVNLSGPNFGSVGQAQTFSTAVEPVDVSTPLTYTWSAEGQPAGPVNVLNVTVDSANYTWNIPGTYVLTVTVNNEGGSVFDTHTIIISETVVPPTPLTSVSLSGPTAGTVNTAYSFMAAALPTTATTPITYTWTADGQGASVVQSGGANTTSPNFTWPAPGTYVITVTATNPGGGVVTATHSIVISEVVVPPTPVGSASLTGPTTGQVNQVYNFTASAGPANATLPLTYTWTATDLAGRTVSVSALSNQQGFSWTTPGTKTISVNIVNAGGGLRAIATHQIYLAVPLIAPSTVSLSGPTTGQTGQTLTFVALVSPANASGPLTYLWSADGQTAQTPSNSDSTSFRWDTPGTYTVRVSVGNAAGSQLATLTVVISAPPNNNNNNNDDDDKDDDDDVAVAAAPASAPQTAPTPAPLPANFPTLLPETGFGLSDAPTASAWLWLGLVLGGVAFVWWRRR